ncbi:MAG TPA: apolipoprotein N-acyltransferase [Myxococcota bacterium]|nr:apolipoprotein N-acyltransferase [Myxococcota bacterium]HQP96021.1 apolipoprotein N-acyltransferase [Myxococcota bacterium]
MTGPRPVQGGANRKSGNIPLPRRLLPVVLSAAGGLCILLSFPRFDLYWLAWFGAAFMTAAFRGRGFRQAFGLGMVAGFIANMGGFYWISNMLQEFAHMPVWLSWVITCLLVAYQGVYYALAAGVAAAATLRWPRLPWLVAFPVAYTAFEFIYPLIFPWYAANGQQLFYAVIQIADLAGAPVISFVLMFLGTAIGEAGLAIVTRKRFPKAGTLAAAALLAAVLVYGTARIATIDDRVASAPTIRVGLVEADVGIWDKEAKNTDGTPLSRGEKNGRLLINLIRHQYLSARLEAEHHPDLIVWPETAYLPMKHVYVKRQGAEEVHPEDDSSDGVSPVLPDALIRDGYVRAWPIPSDSSRLYVSSAPLPSAGSPERPLNGVKADEAVALADRNAAIRGFATPLLFGSSTVDPAAPADRRLPGFNSAILAAADGSVLGVYHKTRLLIFGEYLPFEKYFPFLRKLFPEAGDWTPGHGPEIFRLGDARIGVSICYEDLLAGFHRDMFALGPNLLVNITNDAWFGKTREPWLHLQLAELRSVETRMFMARATNTGISAFVDPVGRRISHTSMDDPEILVADVGLTAERTVYMRIGDVFAWACCVFTLGLIAVAVIGRRRSSTS